MDSPARSVLLTGATGLLGSYTARQLLQNPRLKVYATKRRSSPMQLLVDDVERIHWLEGDLLDPFFILDAVQNIDIIIHTAGLVSYKSSDAKLLRQLNVDVTANLVNAAIDKDVSHFIHYSSIAAISPAKTADLIHESHQTFHLTENTTRYARSKYEAELEVWRGKEEGLPITILNPSVVLGAGFWDRSSCRLFPWVDAGQKFYPPGATGYVDVRDVAAFAKTCIDTGPLGKRIILSAENWKYQQFFEAVAKTLQTQPPTIKVNAFAAELAWRLESFKAAVTGKSPLLTKESARRSMTKSTFDNSLSQASGAVYRPLEETIKDTATVYKQTKAQGFGIF